ncbi:RNA 2',3'-cyclic phosphodiesterase [Jeongeupia sp. HS-3]|nr:RNA 2',3'-cyclic phosphodiesterase [Jeongeupia sp. HS-3]
MAPSAPVRKAIATERDRLHAVLGGKPTSTANLHLTLAFIGQASVQTVQSLRQLIAGIDAPRFAIDLDIASDFKHGGIVWLGCSTPSPSLLVLADTLREALADGGVDFDPQPFAAHVTLLRKGTPVAETLGAAIHWPVDAVVLYVSESTSQGVRYRPLYRHALK